MHRPLNRDRRLVPSRGFPDRYSAAAFFITLVFILIVTLLCAVSITLPLTSDPACYLNYGKILSQGKILFDYPAADIVFDMGGSFEASVLNGYVFSTPDRRLFPVVGVGFPFLVALVIKFFGLSAGTMVNVLLLPFFLGCYWMLLLRALPGEDPKVRYLVPLISMMYLFWAFQDGLASWIMPYRELPALTLAFLALIVAMGKTDNRRGHVLRSLGAGAFLGLACLVRETAIIMFPVIALIMWNAMAVSGRGGNGWIKRTTIILLISIGVLLAYSPQFLVNYAQRGELLTWQSAKVLRMIRRRYPIPGGKEVQHTDSKSAMGVAAISTTGQGSGADIQKADMTAGLAGVSKLLQPFTESLWSRLSYIYHYRSMSTALIFALLGLLFCFWRGCRNFFSISFIPFVLYLMLNSVLIPTSKGHGQRYELVLFVFLVPLAVLGALKVVSWVIRAAGRDRLWCLAYAGVAGIMCLVLIPRITHISSGIGRQPYSVLDLARLEREMNDVIPDNTIILADYPAKQFFEYLSRGNAVDYFELTQQNTVSVKEVLKACSQRSSRLLFLKSKNQSLGESPYASREIEGMLRSQANLKLLHTFPVGSFHMGDVFDEGELHLYGVDLPTRLQARITLDQAYRGKARLVLDLGHVDKGEMPLVRYAGREIEGIVIGRGLFIGSLPGGAITGQTEVEVILPEPIPEEIRGSMIPANAAMTIKFGIDGRELPWLAERWVSGKRPTIRTEARVLPVSSALDLTSAKVLFQGTADVYLGIHPVRRRDVRVSFVKNDHQKQSCIQCLDGNSIVNGLLIRDWPVDKRLWIENKSKGLIYVHTLALGQRVTNLTINPLVDPKEPQLWKTVVIPPGETEVAKELLIKQTVGLDEDQRIMLQPLVKDVADEQGNITVQSKSGQEFFVIEKLTLPAGYSYDFKKHKYDTTMGAILHSGFYALETGGRWTSGKARILLPLQSAGSTLNVLIRALDHRPPDMAPAVVNVIYKSKTIFSTKIEKRGSPFDICFPIAVGETERDPELDFIEIDVSAWRPSESIPESTDNRLLGIFVKSIEMLLAIPD